MQIPERIPEITIRLRGVDDNKLTPMLHLTPLLGSNGCFQLASAKHDQACTVRVEDAPHVTRETNGSGAELLATLGYKK